MFRVVASIRAHPVAAGAVLLTAFYLHAYLSYAALPGNRADYPLGWWGWFDQSQYLKSTLAFARRDLSATEHWYPTGYAALGALFAGPLRMRMHPFFFVDLASLLAAYATCVAFMRRAGVGAPWAVGLFLLASTADPILFEQWAIPWNTTPAAAALWLLLATAAAHMAGDRRPAVLGLLAACVPLLRPTDGILVLPAVLGALAMDIRCRRLHWQDIAWFAAAALGLLTAAFLLHLGIYGPAASEYMRQSQKIGFAPWDLPWKAYVVLVDPRAWFGGGMGLLARCPWLILGIAGLMPAMRRPATAMLAITLLLHSALYLSYVDLLPTGFWKYLNVHYWTWSFPGWALLGVLLVRDLVTPGQRRLPAAALGVTALLLCIRIDPATAEAGDDVRAIDLAVERPVDEAYFGRFQMTDAAGPLENIRNVRAIAMPGRLRIMALTRPIRMPVTVPEMAGAAQAPLRERLGFGLPGWLRARGDDLGPRR